MRKRLLQYLFFALIIPFVSTSARAQQEIKGSCEADGTMLPGVTITVKGSSRTVQTDDKGQFNLNAPPGSVLVVSHTGYKSKEIKVTGNGLLSIELEADAGDLQQVVVVGYGTQKKKDLTGAVSIVDPDQLKKRQATTVAEAMQGLASGVYVRGGGQPGSEANIQIRGIKNLSNTQPLYVIDGMITTANRDFNPNDIESIQILKDASAAAIYGSRAANGVIIITTKNGSEGPMKVEFNGKSSIQIMPRYKLAETEEFTRLNYMAYDNAAVPRQQLETANNTDWQDEAYQSG
ncbi:MAG TPA: TonB-dependent receptor plug domain-containing protein, partial [Flavitalea sp.]|nr:TonB-dependent receptor plug domain-containing protein [Flavitalea sp.]